MQNNEEFFKKDSIIDSTADRHIARVLGTSIKINCLFIFSVSINLISFDYYFY